MLSAGARAIARGRWRSGVARPAPSRSSRSRSAVCPVSCFAASAVVAGEIIFSKKSIKISQYFQYTRTRHNVLLHLPTYYHSSEYLSFRVSSLCLPVPKIHKLSIFQECSILCEFVLHEKGVKIVILTANVIFKLFDSIKQPTTIRLESISAPNTRTPPSHIWGYGNFIRPFRYLKNKWNKNDIQP